MKFSLRGISAFVVGSACCLLIWFLVPYNNFSLDNTYISDSYLPEIVIGLMMVLVLLINPLLRLLGAKWVFNREQITLICGMMLFASILPSNGLMRMFPRLVAQINQQMHTSPTTSEIYAEGNFRQALFPDPLPKKQEDGTIRTVETRVSDQFLDELYEGETIPWNAWIRPLASWGMLITSIWMMMLGLGGVVYPQWRDKERLPFPLLNVYHAFIGDSDEGGKSGRILPAVFYSRVFWIGCIVVFIIHGFRGLNIFTGGAVPSFPLSWNLGAYFTDGLMRHAALPIRFQTIFFAVVGVAYFIPSRYAISIWGWVYGYAWYITLGRAYIPGYNGGQVEGQAFGALLAITGWVLWLGRSHWYLVGQSMFGRAERSEENRRNAVAGWMFVIGCCAIVLWLIWAGASLWWSILAMLGCAMIGLLMARIIAETGVPALWMGRMSIAHLTSLFPLAWQSPVILLFVGVFNAIVTRTTAVSAAVISTLAMGLDREAKPSKQSRFLFLGMVVLFIGFIVCSVVHLQMGYGSAEITTNPKVSASAVNNWARLDRAGDFEFFSGTRFDQAVGLVGGIALLMACSRFPAWPIHPVGILFVRISIGHLMWFSIFLGWLLKTFITRLFGGGAYRKARPLFLGLIIGELAAILLWAIVPVLIIHFTGAMPFEVPRYILLKYP
jgi:hypothetical protein